MASAGALDTSFAGDGTTTIDFGGSTDAAHAVVVQPNGRIVVAGGGGPASSFCVARLRPGGALDTTFGSGGKRTVEFGGDNAAAFGAAALPNGKIMLAGFSDLRVAVARLNPNGSLDTTFSGDGKRTLSWASVSGALAVHALANGKTLLAGFSGPEGGDMQAARLNANGALDTTFGTGGSVAIDFGGTEFGHAIARQADGRILVAGRTDPGGAVVARLRARGSLDPTFDGDGRVVLSSEGIAKAVLVQTDGKIVVAGNAPGIQAMTVTRLLSNDSLDTTFDGDGTATIDFGPRADQVGGAVLQADGKIVAAGSTQADEAFAVARLTADGSRDATFGTGRKATVGFGVAAFGNAVALQPNGRIVVVGQKTGGGDFALARLLA